MSFKKKIFRRLLNRFLEHSSISLFFFLNDTFSLKIETILAITHLTHHLNKDLLFVDMLEVLERKGGGAGYVANNTNVQKKI